AQAGAEAHEIHYEETAWKARPDFSPDGKRLVYSSYVGQQWHQLWVMPASGGDAFALSYGDFDNVAPRWSPDAKRIAFISNRGGNTSLWTQEVLGGAQARSLSKTSIISSRSANSASPCWPRTDARPQRGVLLPAKMAVPTLP